MAASVLKHKSWRKFNFILIDFEGIAFPKSDQV